MSLSYKPSNNATAGVPWDTAFLSDRDVSSQVPVNYVPHPGIHVTPACFANGVYDNNETQVCLSNLLASEIRRFVFDLYWDPTNRVFGFCPVRIPSRLVNTTGTTVAVQIVDTTVSLNQISRNPDARLNARQTSGILNTSLSVSGNDTTSTIITASTTPTSSLPPISSTTDASGNTLLQLGPYQCSTDLNVDSISSLFNDYQYQTSNTIDARLQYLVFNLHVAALYTAPTSTPDILTGAELPRSSEVLSTHFSSIDQYFYTPGELSRDRSNLNASWYRQPTASQLPLISYFITEKTSDGSVRTPDGWPNEEYVQINLGRRIIAGIGKIDDQLAGYPEDADGTLLFASGELYVDQNVQLDSTGSLLTGCFYDGSESSVRQVNNSWAVANIVDLDLGTLSNAADNLTCCGISPVLNYTINNQDAASLPYPYQDFGDQALFSWAVGEPRNTSSSVNGTTDPQFRCALMVSNTAYRGHWRVGDCQQRYRVACRHAEQPYLWRISTNNVTFKDASGACTSDATFSVPRTGLENTYLYHQILNISNQSQQDYLSDGVWINFNSLDVASCWVTTGADGKCPYNEDADAIRQKQILVPAIAALIVILLTALMILVKCNDNRRNSKVRKRGEGGWDYEGVPS